MTFSAYFLIKAVTRRSFGAGSIVGMALLSLVIAIPLRLSASRLAWLHKGMTAAVGGFSCLSGAVMVYRIGFVERLLLG